MGSRIAVVLALAALAASPLASAQDPARIVTRADVEKVTGQKFKDGTKPMAGQVSFSQDGGDLTVSVDLEPREASRTVRGWEATMKKMQPGAKVETVPGVGKDAIFYSTRPDRGARRRRLRQPAGAAPRRGQRCEDAGAGQADQSSTWPR